MQPYNKDIYSVFAACYSVAVAVAVSADLGGTMELNMDKTQVDGSFFRHIEPYNTPIHDYRVEKIDLNNKNVEFLTADDFDKTQKCWQMANQTKKNIPRKCLEHNCKNAELLRDKKNLIYQRMNKTLASMGPLCIKTKRVYTFDPKPKRRNTDQCNNIKFKINKPDTTEKNVDNISSCLSNDDAAIRESFNTFDSVIDLDNKDRVVVLPPPSGYTFASVNIFNKMIKNDQGYQWDGVNLKTGEKVVLDSSMFPHKTSYDDQKTVLNVPLRSGSIKSQIQGGPSLMRKSCQCPKVNNVGRGTILPCPSLPPDVVILPASAQHNLGIIVSKIYTVHDLPNLTDNDFTALPKDMVIIMKRDPSLKMGSTVLVTRVAFVKCDSIYISILIIHHMHADFDGDCLVLFVISGWRAAIEATLTMQPSFSMYLQFLDTRLIFSQSHALHMYLRSPELYCDLYNWVRDREMKKVNVLPEVVVCRKKVDDLLEKYSHLRTASQNESYVHGGSIDDTPGIIFENTLTILNKTLLYITLLYGSLEAYKFVMHITELTTKWSRGTLTIPDNSANRKVANMLEDNILSKSIFSVLGSGAKGTSAGYCALLDLLNHMDETIMFTPEDNTKLRMNSAKPGDEFHIDHIHSQMLQVIKHMIWNSSKIASHGYEYNTKNVYVQHAYVVEDRAIKYNQTVICNDYELMIDSELLCPSDVAYYIFIQSDSYKRNMEKKKTNK